MEVIWETPCLLGRMGEGGGEQRWGGRKTISFLLGPNEFTVGREGSILVFLLVFSWSRKYITRKHLLMLGCPVLAIWERAGYRGAFLVCTWWWVRIACRCGAEETQRAPCHAVPRVLWSQSHMLSSSYLSDTSHACLLLYVQSFFVVQGKTSEDWDYSTLPDLETHSFHPIFLRINWDNVCEDEMICLPQFLKYYKHIRWAIRGLLKLLGRNKFRSKRVGKKWGEWKAGKAKVCRVGKSCEGMRWQRPPHHVTR